MPSKKCKMCKKVVRGRSDKIFCSISCKSIYHNKLKSVNQTITQEIDKILHRNRAILLEVLGKTRTSKQILKIELDQRMFNYSYYTATHLNKKGKRVYLLYDFTYFIFTDQNILITRNHRFLDHLSKDNDLQ